MKIDRLLAIVMVLLERDKISANRLAQMFEVSTRTIYRDINTLALSGIPVVSWPGVNGGISILPQYKIDKKLFTQADIMSILRGLNGLSATSTGSELLGTVTKIKSLLPANEASEIEFKANQIAIDMTPWIKQQYVQTHLELSKKAIDSFHLLSFNYLDGKGNPSQRQVEPYQLLLKEGYWYLRSFCYNKQQPRTFKLSRISDLQILEQVFTPRHCQFESLHCRHWGHQPFIRISLLIDRGLKEKLLTFCDEQDFQPYDSHRLLVDFPFVADEMGFNLLLGFGDKCICLAPESIRLALIERIDRLARLYLAELQ